jgi:hypothetical protein
MIRVFLILILFSIFSLDSQGQINIDSLDKERFIKKSTILSALIPSAGQIHNTKIKPDHVRSRIWWKIPVIYGGISTTGYFIYFNQNEFKNIRTERLNRQNGIAPNLYAFYSSSQLKILQEEYRRLRDISVISFLGFYLLQIIDANVEANLFLFDTDDNLSLKMDLKNYNGTLQPFLPSLTFTYTFNNKKSF